MKYLTRGLILSSLVLCFALPANAETRSIVFPVFGQNHYSDDFGAPRTGHTHEGNDIFASKMTPIVAAVDGRVRFVVWPEATYGYMISIEDEAGYSYRYIHINNDTPGTDDGSGGGRNAYAPYVETGADVVAGQLIGWVGDSGNAEGTSSHLHFEIRTPDGEPINPYDSLRNAKSISSTKIAPQRDDEILPYGEFTGGAHIAIGNFDTDASDLEIVTGAGPGGGPHVRVMTRSGYELAGWFAFYDEFRGGVDVATADINGDGKDEIVVGAGPGAGPYVSIYRSNGKLIYSWFAYDPAFHGGVNVSAADLDGDGKDEIITGAGPGGGPHVRTFKPDGTALASWFAYESGFRGGVDVTGKDKTLTSPARVITGAGPGGEPAIRVFLSNGTFIRSFLAYADTFRGGVRVDMANILDQSKALEIATVPASSGGVDVRYYSIKGDLRDTDTEFENWWTGGYDIAAADDTTFIVSGQDGRRASVRRLN